MRNLTNRQGTIRWRQAKPVQAKIGEIIVEHAVLSRARSRTRGRCLLLSVAALCAMPAAAASRDQILVAGSSTVYPFSAIVAEHFAKSGPFRTPTIQSGSTGEGFKLFCAGIGGDTPDIANASRRMSPDERASCAANGVRKITEVQIGYDSLILANGVGSASFTVTLDQFWRAVARVVPVNGEFIPNPYQNWHDIAATLPNQPIKLFGPAPGHGTRDALVTLVMEQSCLATAPGAKLRAAERDAVCGTVRKDGRWTDVENLELILGKLASNTQAVGILTYSYLEQFPNRIHAAAVAGITPTRATIRSGTYPISRPLYMYVKNEHLRMISGLAEYAAEFLSFCAAGANGYLLDEGLVALPMPELLRQRTVVARLQR